MSICVGANVLASTGLLSGKSATTHHDSYRTFGMAFADIDVKRGVRYVEDGNLATSGGLTSGIDLALHVVERYFGRDVAKATAYQMEYQGQGWTDVNSNVVYTAAPHPAVQIKTCRGNRTLGVNLSTAILHAITDRPFVNIQPDVIHTLHGGASFGVSESARSLSSAFVHQALLQTTYTFKLIGS